MMRESSSSTGRGASRGADARSRRMEAATEDIAPLRRSKGRADRQGHRLRRPKAGMLGGHSVGPTGTTLGALPSGSSLSTSSDNAHFSAIVALTEDLSSLRSLTFPLRPCPGRSCPHSSPSRA